MLSPAAQTAVDDALAAFLEKRAANARAAAATTDPVTGWWDSIIGADTAAEGVRNAARGDDLLLSTWTAKAARITTDAEAADLVRSIGVELKRPDLTETARKLTLSAAAAEVAGETAKDLAKTAQGVGDGFLAVLKASPYLLAALALLFVWTWLPKRRAP